MQNFTNTFKCEKISFKVRSNIVKKIEDGIIIQNLRKRGLQSKELDVNLTEAAWLLHPKFHCKMAARFKLGGEQESD
ncbi:hypothetical protein L1987_61614 [Smallanthus sonchifolius]|uniref:Uncharacterized protein n=1 Tax=Smallanthus sonchifolius TaxID=185202 RepID=A0ACB9C830_9ASTR|nr:hypothetical protein L1987_61614 [Smallanthus sonchifolius]